MRCSAGKDEWCCVRQARRNGLCGGHSAQVRDGKEITPLKYQRYGGRHSLEKKCAFQGCTNESRIRGYCSGHNKQIREGRELKALRKWEPHDWLPDWGKPWLEKRDGYMYVHHATKRLKMSEHRAVMEWMIGRPLFQDENVHHINGVRHDNRPENLELWSTKQPYGQRIEDKVAWAKELIERYEPEWRSTMTS